MDSSKIKGQNFSDQMAISQNTIDVLNAIIKYEPTYQREIAKKTKLSESTVNYIFRHLLMSGVVESVAAVDEETGRLIRKIKCAIDKEDLIKVISIFKAAMRNIRRGRLFLIEAQKKALGIKTKSFSFRERRKI